MLKDIYTETIIEQIGNLLKQYETIFLISNDAFSDISVENEVINRLKEVPENLVLSVCESQLNESLQDLWGKDFSSIYKLYCMYEFANNIHLLSDNKHFGTIFNYVDAGIITLREAIEVLLQ